MQVTEIGVVPFNFSNLGVSGVRGAGLLRLPRPESHVGPPGKQKIPNFEKKRGNPYTSSRKKTRIYSADKYIFSWMMIFAEGAGVGGLRGWGVMA